MLAFAAGGDACWGGNKTHPMLLQENHSTHCLEPPEVTRVSHRLQRAVDKAHKEFFTADS